MNKFANVQEAAQANLAKLKYHLATSAPEDIDISDLPDNFIDLLVTVGRYYQSQTSPVDDLTPLIPTLDEDAITLPDAFAYFLMAISAVDIKEVHS